MRVYPMCKRPSEAASRTLSACGWSSATYGRIQCSVESRNGPSTRDRQRCSQTLRACQWASMGTPQETVTADAKPAEWPAERTESVSKASQMN